MFPVLVRRQALGPRQGEGEGDDRGWEQEEPSATESCHHQQWPLQGQGQGGEARQRALRAAAAAAQQQAPGPH